MEKNKNPTPQFTLHQGEIVNDFELKNGFLSIHQSAALYSFLTEIHQKLLAFTKKAVAEIFKIQHFISIRSQGFQNSHEGVFPFRLHPLLFNKKALSGKNLYSFEFAITAENPNHTRMFCIKATWVEKIENGMDLKIISDSHPVYEESGFIDQNTQTKIKTLDTLNTYLGTILVETLGENWQSL